MTTNRRNTYNLMRELAGTIDGIEFVINNKLTLDQLNKIVDLHSNHLSELQNKWIKEYSTNPLFKSTINLEGDSAIYEQLFYSSDRIKLYNDIKHLSGYIHGLILMNTCLNNSEVELNSIKNIICTQYSNVHKTWKENYEHNKTHNSYELDS